MSRNIKLVTALALLVGVLSSAVIFGWVDRFPAILFVGVGVFVFCAMNLLYLRRGWGIMEIYPNPRNRFLLLSLEMLSMLLALTALMN